jgi:hypothetical protein
MKRLFTLGVAGLALYAVASTTGCEGDQRAAPSQVATAKTGTLGMNLEATSASGKIYRLRAATFLVDSLGNFTPFLDKLPVTSVDAGVSLPPPIFSDGGGFPGTGGTSAGGSTFGSGGSFSAGGSGGFSGGFPTSSTETVLSSETDLSKTVLETFLAPSEYEVQLVDGWFMEQVDQLLGTTAVVSATLENGPFQIFSITSNQETFVQYVFDVNGERVQFGPPGRLIIGIQVNETGGSCGDGVVNGTETCDGNAFGGNTCATATLGAEPFGFLLCTSVCKFDTSQCFGGGTGGGTGAGGITGAGGGFGIDGGFGGFGGFGGTGGTGPGTGGKAASDAGVKPVTDGSFFKPF